jgi:hypothetical protein
MSPISLCRPLLVLFILLLSIGPALAKEQIELLFAKGNQAYSSGDYATAIASYQAITRVAGYSPAVLYNLANSFAQSGNTGMAVLHYQRALRLSPGDPDIAGNLELLRKKRGLFARHAPGIERLLDLFTLPQYALLFLATLTLYTVFSLLSLHVKPSLRLRLTVAILAGLLIITAIAGMAGHSRKFNPAVVVASDARLLLSPFPASASVGAIQEGRLVYPEKSHDGFSFLTDETGRKGWLPTTALLFLQETAKSGKE